MKYTLALRPLTLLCATSAMVAQAAFGDSVTPEEPEAYETFILEIEVRNRGPGTGFEYVVDVDLNANIIQIGYLNHGPDFSTPPSFRTMAVQVQGLPPGTYEVSTAYMPFLADDDLDVEETGFSFTVSEAPPTQRAYGFYNRLIEHYFVTASDDEADGLLAQDGWEIVDFGFNVWHADDPAPETAVPVCRFYSELVNSHFYTGSEEECTLLQEEDQGWEYEGIAFQALLPVNGACPAGTAPVWRLYNNRFAQLDSNHRFVASSETYRAMIAEGWAGEGVAFCSPPVSV